MRRLWDRGARAARTWTRRRTRPRVEGLEGRALLNAGDLDLTFGSGGLVTRDFGTADSDQARALAVQPDGKILVGSDYRSPGSKGTYDLAVARYNPDGSPDTGFGSGGLATVDFAGQQDHVRKILVDPNSQKIILVGYTSQRLAGGYQGYDYALARLNPNGTLDTTFGTKGKTQLSVDNYDSSRDAALDSRGRIVVGGSSSTFPIYLKNTTSYGYEDVLLRFNANGTLDTTFGSSGKVVGAQGAGSGDSWDTLRMLADDSISALGTDGRQGVVAHVTAAGVRDRRIVLTPPANPFSATLALSGGGNAFQPDGKILSIQAPATFADSGTIYLVRYNPDGTPDAGFGTGGVAMTDLRVPGENAGVGAPDVAFASDGRIVIGGSYNHNPIGVTSPLHSLLLRYNADGSLDDGSANDSTPGDSFGPGGVVIQALSPYGDAVTRLAILPDGKILAAGYADTGTAVDSSGNHVVNDDVALARFLGGSGSASVATTVPVRAMTASTGDLAAPVPFAPASDTETGLVVLAMEPPPSARRNRLTS